MRKEIHGFWPPHWLLDHVIRHGLAEIITNQIEDRRDIMAAIDDAKAKLEELKTDVATLIARPQGGTSDADVQSFTDALTALDNDIKATLGTA